MNFKKFISGVSAFAIAASAFAGMAVTANAETLYSQDYESATTADWRTSTSGRYTPVIIDNGSNKFLSVDQNSRYNNGATITSPNLGIPAEKDYTMTFDAILSAGNNQAATVTIKGADNKAIVTATAAAATAKWTINGSKEAEIGYVYGTGTTDANLDNYTWHSYKLTSYEGKTYLTIDGLLETTALTGVESSGGLGTVTFASGRYFANFAIDNVVIRDVDVDNDLPSTPQGDFSVVYKTEAGATLTKTSSGSGDVDSAPSITAADKADFVENGQKYIYVSDNAANVTIAGDNTTVVTVTVRAAASYVVTVNGSEDTELAKANVFEGDSTSYSYPKYLTDDNKKVAYVADETTFTKTVAPTEDTTITVPYTAFEGTAYFVDHEEITSTAALASGNFSNGSASRAVNDGVAAFTVAEAGTYSISVAASCRNSGNSSVFAVYKNAVEDDNLIFNDDVKGTSQNTVQTSGIKTKADVELEAGDVIIIQGDNGNTWVDYVYAVKTSVDTPDPSAEAGAATNVVTYSGDQYEGEATSALVTVSYANMLADKTITLEYNGTTNAVSGATGFTGNGNIVVGVVIEGSAVSNPVFTAGVE